MQKGTLARPRTWSWLFIGVQVVGFAIDAAWHGLLHPGFEAATSAEMLHHLLTVHLVLYAGVAGLLLSTVWALVERSRRGERGLAVPVAFAGALLQTAGETLHVVTHLRLAPEAVFPPRSRACSG